MVSMATPLHCGDTKDSSNHEAKLCQGIGFCLFTAGSATAAPACFLLCAPPSPQAHWKAGAGSTQWDVIKVLWLVLQTRLPFQFPLYTAVYCCIPSKSPSERWGSHSCSSSETQNVILAIESSPTKQHSLSPEHSIACLVFSYTKQPPLLSTVPQPWGTVRELSRAVLHTSIPVLYRHTANSCCTAQTHGCSLQLYENRWHQTEVAPAEFGCTLQELYFVALISFLQFTSPSSRPTSSKEWTMWLANQTLLLIAVITFLGPIAEPGKLTTVSRVQP